MAAMERLISALQTQGAEQDACSWRQLAQVWSQGEDGQVGRGQPAGMPWMLRMLEQRGCGNSWEGSPLISFPAWKARASKVPRIGHN